MILYFWSYFGNFDNYYSIYIPIQKRRQNDCIRVILIILTGQIVLKLINYEFF